MSESLYVIWSEEHRGWWAGKSGYTGSLLSAGRFTQAEAIKIVNDANRYAENLCEVAFPAPAIYARRKRNPTGIS